MAKVKKSFWLEQEQANKVEKRSNTLKVTESQVIRNLIENL